MGARLNRKQMRHKSMRHRAIKGSRCESCGMRRKLLARKHCQFDHRVTPEEAEAMRERAFRRTNLPNLHPISFRHLPR